jgi:hypothetical protein
VRDPLSEVRLHEQLYANGGRGGEVIAQALVIVAYYLLLRWVWRLHGEVTQVIRKYNESEKGS